MKRDQLLSAIFFLILAIFFYLFYQIIIPFFVPIVWAAVFVVLLYPLYTRLLKKIKSRVWTSLLMCVVLVVLIIGPITYLIAVFISEAAEAATTLREMYRSGELEKMLSFNVPVFDAVKTKLAEYYDLLHINPEKIIKDLTDKFSAFLFDQTSWLIANTTKTVFYFVLMIFTTYYFFKDGGQIIAFVKRLMPIKPEQVESTFNKLGELIQATMYGGVIVALIQGTLGGILFAIVGISSPIFWGAVMAFLSLIPFVGAFLVFIPAGIMLLLQGEYFKGLFVIAFGMIVISQIDNVIRPYLISGRTEMHPLLLFFSLMGGIALFGLLGIVVGPLIAAIFVALLKIVDLRLHPSDETVLSEPSE
jgi:predicted PurR-regulated permease PerM